MLDLLRESDRATERKLRLFACACCRLVWHVLPGLCHSLVATVEQYADGESWPGDLLALFGGYRPRQVSAGGRGGDQTAEAVGRLSWDDPWPTGPSRLRHLWLAGGVARSAAEALAKTVPWEEAPRLLEELAAGEPRARLTREALASLRRLEAAARRK